MLLGFSDREPIKGLEKVDLFDCDTSALLTVFSAVICKINIAIYVLPQDLQPLSIQAMSPGVQMQGGRGLISPSQGLLATADSTLGPLAAPSLNHAPQKCPQLPGLKLLQLHPTLLTSDGPPTEASPSRWAEPRNSNHPGGAAYPALGGRVPFSSAHDPVSSRVLKSEQMPRGQEVPLPVLQSPDSAPMQGLRLLHCHSPAQNDISALKLPRLPSFRPGPGLSLPTGDVPIKLLQIESGPKMVRGGDIIFCEINLATLRLTPASDADVAGFASSAGSSLVHGAADGFGF